MIGLDQHFFVFYCACCKAPPKFPKEIVEPAVVKEGDPVVLECNPPKGIPPCFLYWMTIGKYFFFKLMSSSANGSLSLAFSF